MDPKASLDILELRGISSPAMFQTRDCPAHIHHITIPIMLSWLLIEAQNLCHIQVVFGMYCNILFQHSVQSRVENAVAYLQHLSHNDCTGICLRIVSKSAYLIIYAERIQKG